MRRIATRAAGLVMGAALVLALVGCAAAPRAASVVSPVPSVPSTPSAPSAADVSEAKTLVADLLRTYKLHQLGEATPTLEATITDKNGFMLYADASSDIGLDLRAHLGEQATWYRAALRNSAKEGGQVSVWAIVQNRRIIGAYLVLEDYTPGVISLRDRSYFKP